MDFKESQSKYNRVPSSAQQRVRSYIGPQQQRAHLGRDLRTSHMDGVLTDTDAMS